MSQTGEVCEEGQATGGREQQNTAAVHEPKCGMSSPNDEVEAPEGGMPNTKEHGQFVLCVQNWCLVQAVMLIVLIKPHQTTHNLTTVAGGD